MARQRFGVGDKHVNEYGHGNSNCWKYPDGVAVSPNGEYAYVANTVVYDKAKVSVINTTNNTITATNNRWSFPDGVAITPNSEYAYVANLSNQYGICYKYGYKYGNSDNNPSVSTPDGVAITPNGEYAYVANKKGYGFGNSTATNTITAKITVGSNPYGVAVTPNGAYVYVANE